MGRTAAQVIPSGTICPLYLAHSDKEIVCKSFVPDVDLLIMRYFVKNNRETQYRCFCCGNYQNCEVFRSYQHFSWAEE